VIFEKKSQIHTIYEQGDMMKKKQPRLENKKWTQRLEEGKRPPKYL
jgi:hypothetical protein